MGGHPILGELLTPFPAPFHPELEPGSWPGRPGAGREAKGLPGTEGCMGACSVCISEPTLEETVAQPKKAQLSESPKTAREQAPCESKEHGEICKVGI